MPIRDTTLEKRNKQELFQQTLESIKEKIQKVTSSKLIITKRVKSIGSTYESTIYADFCDIDEVVPCKIWFLRYQKYRVLFSLITGNCILSATFDPKLIEIKTEIMNELEKFISGYLPGGTLDLSEIEH